MTLRKIWMLAAVLPSLPVQAGAQEYSAKEIVELFSRQAPAATRRYEPSPTRELVVDNGVDAGRLPVESPPPMLTPPVIPGSAPVAAATGGCHRPPLAFNAILFERNRARLADDAATERQLGALAQALNSPTLATWSFMVRGHTDATGTRRHNDALSTERAEAVARRLVALGVATNRLRPLGLGSRYLADPSTPASFGNRRVDLCP